MEELPDLQSSLLEQEEVLEETIEGLRFVPQGSLQY